jgi:hypothetical protein
MTAQAPKLTAVDHQAELAEYARAGARRAAALPNRGPLRYAADGRPHPDIVARYWQFGFYVFERVVDPGEIDELRADIDFLLDHAPSGEGAALDRSGRPAYGGQFARPTFLFVRPLSDPWGGTKVLGGRHPTKMREPLAGDGAPEQVVHLINGMCQTMASGLRLYGHPDLLSIAAAINGDDFVPYNDAVFVKLPGLGGSVSWHQDGVTHWDSPNWDEGIHGFNFQVQLYECTAQNGLWVMPGTHKLGRIDIAAMVAANGGSERLPDAVPLLCAPGDVTVVNRQLLHGSFANSSPDPRVSLTFGFHRRSSVLGARGALSQTASEVYDEQRIFERSCLIPVAIDARARHYPGERRFAYAPFAGLEDDYRFTAANRERVVRDYNLKDLSI